MLKDSINKKVVAVVVTYNRKALLQECIDSIQKQSYPVDSIVIIDNASTDGTDILLSKFVKTHSGVISFRMAKNIGGSGGFSEGIKKACKMGSDWLWLMDDDTIPSPLALEKMMEYSDIQNIGFINSLVHWTDGNPHIMNMPKYIDSVNVESKKDKRLETGKVRLVSSASFVSLLIKSEIPFKLGLPYKEFFIWCDDAEYTNRIHKSGYIGLQVLDSRVLHKTTTNYMVDLSTISADYAWKLYYGERNESFVRKKRKGFFRFFFSQWNALRLHRHKIKKRNLPKEEEKKLLNAVLHGLWDGFMFNPKIEYIV